MSLAVASQPSPSLSVEQAQEKPEPIPMPRTYRDLEHVLAIVINGPYAHRRSEMAMTDDESYEIVRTLEHELLMAVAEKGMEGRDHAISSGDLQRVAALCKRLGAPKQSLKERTMEFARGIGAWVKGACESLIGRRAA